MTLYYFLIKLLISLISSASISLLIAISALLLLRLIVYCFKLNHGGDVYWVLTLTTYLFYIFWMVSFAYFMAN